MKVVDKIVKVIERRRSVDKRWDDVYWCQRIEALIRAASGPLITRGPLKGHRRTDSTMWIAGLEREVGKWMEANYRGTYDGNMVKAKLLGRALSVWFCSVCRAKTYDPNRPLKIRQKVNAQLAEYKGALVAAINSDAVMGDVWPNQRFDFPFSKRAKSGKFI